MNMMTDAEAADRIRKLPNDEESAHIEADKILCQLLRQLGYTQTVEAFENLDRWYA